MPKPRDMRSGFGQSLSSLISFDFEIRYLYQAKIKERIGKEQFGKCGHND